MLRTKVLVVGGGPAGTTAACFLGKAGIDTILIERDFSFVKPCGGGLPSSAFTELEIPKKAIKKEISKFKMVSPKGEVLEIKLRGGSLCMVQRGEFDSLLRDETKKNGVQLIDAEFRGLEEGRQIIAKTRIDGKEEQIKADYLIAADGVNSRVRSALGFQPMSFLYTLSAKIKDIEADSCEFWFSATHAPGAYSWVFPEADSASVGTGCFEPKALRGFYKIFLGRRGLNPENINTRMYRIPLWSGELYNKNNILFAGDSAGQAMPLTYEGIYYAMKSGEFAARALIQGKLSDYKRLWKHRFHSRFLIMKKISDYFMRNDSSVERLFSLYRRSELQDVTMRLWLEKSHGAGNLISFINFFRKILS